MTQYPSFITASGVKYFGTYDATKGEITNSVGYDDAAVATVMKRWVGASITGAFRTITLNAAVPVTVKSLNEVEQSEFDSYVAMGERAKKETLPKLTKDYFGTLVK